MVHINISENLQTQIPQETFLGPRPSWTVGKFELIFELFVKRLSWHVDTLFLCFLGQGIDCTC